MLDSCAILQRTLDCSVVLVHHTGVNEEAQHRARGSSAWRGAVEIEISVAKKPDGPIEIIQRKAKDSELMEPVYMALEKVAIPGWLDDDGEQVTSAVLVPSGAPPAPPTPRGTRLERHRQTLERAWEASSRQTDESGRPFISRDELRAYLGNPNTEAMSGMELKNAMRANRPSGLVGALVNAKIIDMTSINSVDGFYVVNPTDAFSIIMGAK
jgi:hypothetical protein